MRIPSDLHERNLYRERTHVGRKSPFAARRLLRLVVMLIVVVWVMRKAADPKIYTAFFPQKVAVPPGMSGSGTSTEGNGTRNLVPAGGTQADSGMPRGSADDRLKDSYAADVAALSLRQQRQLTVWLWELRRRGQTTAGDDLSEQTFSLADLFLAPEGQPSRPSTDELDPVNELPIPQSLVDLSLVGRHALQEGLDRTYQDRVVDGAVFRAADFDAFYRYLEQASDENFADLFWNAQPAPRQVGVVPLMQQPKAYLGTEVWLTAQVARVVPVSVSQEEESRSRFGVNAYYEVWLRPADGTERPVVLYTPEVSAALQQISADSSLQSGPHVAVAGRFLKRRLYASVGGATECPVIVGRVWDQQADQAAAATTPRSAPPWKMVVSLAGLLGVTLAVGLFWRSTVAARQTRRVRQASLSMAPEFAAALAASDVVDPKQKEEVVDPQYDVKTAENP